MSKSAQHKLLSINQAAKVLGISAATLRLWEKKKLITSRRTPGNQRRYTLEDIKNIKERTVPSNISAREIDQHYWQLRHRHHHSRPPL